MHFQPTSDYNLKILHHTATLLFKPFFIVIGLVLLYVIYCNFWLVIQIEYAYDQVTTFTHMEKRAHDSQELDELNKYLTYVRGYYPSGTKQKTGTRLDWLVEDRRRISIHAISAIIERVKNCACPTDVRPVENAE